MATYLFSWNPSKWNWTTLDADIETYQRQKFFDEPWSCGVTKKIVPGDRAFLIRLGPFSPSGIMASGLVSSSTYKAEHYSDPNKTALYVGIRFDVLLHPEKEQILGKTILQKEIKNINWTPQASGMTIPPDEAALLEALWSAHLTQIGLSPLTLSEEILTPERYWEGAIRRISINAYERDPRARQACLQHHGSSCSICGFDFESTYGEIGKGFIHVHHLRQLSEIGEAYEVDPLHDLMPVCPNCHAMLHKQVPAYSADELKVRIQKS